MAPLVIAHRTAPLDAAENSLAGIAAAARLGADVVEVDVRRTLDGVPVLLHDATPRRTTGRILPVMVTPLALLRRQTVAATGLPVPTLAEALDALADTDMRMAVDTKHPSATRAVVKVAQAAGMLDRCLLWCRQRRGIAVFRAVAPTAQVALLRDTSTVDQTRRMFDDAVDWGAHAVSLHWDAVDGDVVADAHRRGLVVYAWNEHGAGDVAEKAALGLDGIVTDWIDDTRRVLSLS